ncbi:MAG: hypothetical protein N3A54_02590 [Patescibacteria group bacterium]|nr:hypothetical protein [Patescibacteria group bacterium]
MERVKIYFFRKPFSLLFFKRRPYIRGRAKDPVQWTIRQCQETFVRPVLSICLFRIEKVKNYTLYTFFVDVGIKNIVVPNGAQWVEYFKTRRSKVVEDFLLTFSPFFIYLYSNYLLKKSFLLLLREHNRKIKKYMIELGKKNKKRRKKKKGKKGRKVK